MSDKEDVSTQSSKDQELDDLLDSAIVDFDKYKKDEPAKSPNSNETKDLDFKPDEIWNEEFLASQAKVFEEKMASLFGNAGNAGQAPSSEEISLGFQRMAEAAAMALQPETENVADPQFTQSISDALKGLNVGQENLSSPFNPDDISRMFGGMDMNDSGASNQFLPFMQGMMQSLLSAEVLLPSLKDLVEKYPKWLAENGSKINPEDRERYEKQQKLMEQVCADLENEKPNDSPEVKKERFHKVLENMGKMQDLGQPPNDLVGDLGQTNIPGFQDPSAFQDPSQCSIM